MTLRTALRTAGPSTGVLGAIFSIILVLILTACGGGGGGDGESLDSNSCDVLGLNTRIVNGTPCSDGGSPVVKISLVNRNFTQGLCSGTMISRDDVLTAAHCFLLSDVQSAFIEVGGRRVFGRRVTIHPDAAIDRALGLAFNDVAVLNLEEPVSLPSVPILTSRAPESGEVFSIFGFGLDENENPGTLRSGDMKIDSVTPNHVIASFDGDGSTTCNGDSGGPAILSPLQGADDVSQASLIAVVSSGTSRACEAGDVAFFTNLQKPEIVDFIRNTVPDARFD